MTLPSATTRLDDQSGGIAVGTDLVCVWAPVPLNADGVPRIYANSQGIYDTHGYSQGLDYSAMHMVDTKKPVMFIPLAIETEGAIGRVDSSDNTGTSAVSVVAGSGGSYEECDGILKVTAGGTIGTDQILLSLSLDGGRSYKPVRLGTANSYTIPYVNQVLNFGAGTLVAGDTILTWHATAPKSGTTAINAALALLVAQQKKVRSWLYIGDGSQASDFDAIKSAVDSYETSNERYCVAKVQCRDRLPLATKSNTVVKMSGNPNLTFAEVGATGDTMTRSAGSWIDDGFVAGDIITISGSASNDLTTAVGIASVTDTVITFDTDDLADEGPVADVTVTGTPAVTFAEVGATGDTITRTRGSWIDDGFRAGDLLVVSGTSLNNFTAVAGVVSVTDTVITMDTDDLADEVIGLSAFTMTAGETKAQAVATLDAAMSSIDGDPRIDIGYGRAARVSPVTGWKFRRPAQWLDSIESYVRDIRTTTWWKALGPIQNWDLNGPDGHPYEHDERVDGGALAARFTCLRTWGNGPAGTFVAQSLTRATDGSILGFTHNMHVANLAQTVNQATTENFAGQTLVLQPPDGTGARYASADSLRELEAKVNKELAYFLLSNVGGEGPRASRAFWKAATDDDLAAVGATLNGTLTLELNGTIVHIQTAVKVS